MQTAWYRQLFPNTVLNPQKISKEEFTTTAKGFRLATSVGGTLTGRGGDIIILDDPLKASDAYSEAARNSCIEWYQTTVQSRLNNPKQGAIIVVAQRLHAQDLPGHLMATGEWDQLILPMEASYEQELDVLRGGRRCRVSAGRLLQPERHGPEELKRLKLEMGERDYEAQYNQRPLPPGGALFKRSWIDRYHPQELDAYEGIFQSWDTAYEVGESTDYSVCTTWGVYKGQFHLLDLFRKRLEFPDLRHSVLALRRKWNALSVVVEGVGSGKSVAQDLWRESGAHDWLRTIKPATSKENRSSQQTIKFEQNKVAFPHAAAWLQELEDELFSFPNGKYDDQVDSIVQFLAAVDQGFLRGGKVEMRIY
jgi:predicted phage terminase large subunit-like protein